MAEFDSFNCRALCRSWRRDDGPYGYARGGVWRPTPVAPLFDLLHIRRYISCPVSCPRSAVRGRNVPVSFLIH